MEKIISKERALEIASQWYDGDKDPLYSFISTKATIRELKDKYIKSVMLASIDKDGNLVDNCDELLDLFNYFDLCNYDYDTIQEYKDK